jgi:uncharacterized membrane protein YidH (DUF202 family)
MPLLGPNDDDRRKLHAEVNQLANQRFLVTTGAITVFGVIMALLVPRNSPQSGTDVGAFIFLMSTMLSVLLFALFRLSDFYKRMMRVYSTYLKITGESHWESDWSQFRQRHSYPGYTKSQTMVFSVLNLIATAFPFLLVIIFDLKCQPHCGCIIALAAGILVGVLMIGMGVLGWFDRERRIEEQWLAIKNK